MATLGSQDIPEIENPAPAGLRWNAIPDARFPMNFQQSVPSAVQVLTNYFSALTARDINGIAENLHFPFGSFEGSQPLVTEDIESFLKTPPPSLSMTDRPERKTDHDGYLQPGCYDTFGSLEVLNANAVCVNIAFTYDRFDRRGHPLLTCDGVYCITNNDGKWAIQAMSTIFTPSQARGIPFDDAIINARRLRFDHCLASAVWDDKELVWGPIRQLGLNIGVSGARPVGRSGILWHESVEGRAMEFFQTKGIKSRLSVEEMTAERAASRGPSFESFEEYREFWNKTGLGNFGWVIGGAAPSRVIHASVDKVHILQGATRFTTSGEFINNSIEMDIITYWKGRWGMAGIWGYITERDRTNDVDSAEA